MLIIKIIIVLILALLIIFLAFNYSAGKVNKALDQAAEDELEKKRSEEFTYNVVMPQPIICPLQYGLGNMQCKIYGTCRPEDRGCER